MQGSNYHLLVHGFLAVRFDTTSTGKRVLCVSANNGCGAERELVFPRIPVCRFCVLKGTRRTHSSFAISFRLNKRATVDARNIKSKFSKHKVDLLAQVSNSDDGAVGPNKVAAIQDAPVLPDQTSLPNIIGKVGYHTRFIKNFAEIFVLLYLPTSRTAHFYRNDSIQEAFGELRRQVSSPSELSFPDFEQPFIVETATSLVTVDTAVSEKKENGKLHPG